MLVRKQVKFIINGNRAALEVNWNGIFMMYLSFAERGNLGLL